MRQRVTAVLVARNGGDALKRTLAALTAQTRAPDSIIAVDAASEDDTAATLSAAGLDRIVTQPPRSSVSVGAGVSHALELVPAEDPEEEWLWLLTHATAPEPDALQHLLAAVEVAPSVGIAGPKNMSWERPDVISGFGESMTTLGASVALVENELDQAQHDVGDDVLGVASAGMLVRRSVFDALGGFDPGLPATDAGLDLSVRARLAGHRVIGVPSARIAVRGGPEHFARDRVSPAREHRLRRRAQLHRRLVYAPALAVPLHWLTLLPLAVLRSIGQLLAKRPSRIPGEFGAAIAAAFDPTVVRSRRRLARSRRLGWRAIAPLRVTAAERRERRAQRAGFAVGAVTDDPKIGYLGGGGPWIAGIAALIGVLAFGPLLGASAVAGGGMLPLSGTVTDLWRNVGIGWREIGTGFFGAADPFAVVLALLGSITFWNPSLAIVAFYFLALPLATASAWFLTRRLTRTPWVPIVGGILWAAAPPFIASLMTGQLGAVIAHILLPTLMLAMIKGIRSVASAALACLLMAVIAAGAPSLLPALLIAWVVWMVLNPLRGLRLLGMPVLTAVLYAPLAIEHFTRGTPLALFVDPGVPTLFPTASGADLALLSPTGALHGWGSIMQGIGQSALAPALIIALLAPVGILVFIGATLPGFRRALTFIGLGLLGFATAVAATRIALTVVGAETATIWPGSALSLFWLGLLGAAVIGLDGVVLHGRTPRLALTTATIASATAVALITPGLLAMHLGTAQVHAAPARLVPAVVEAEATTNPGIGTLMLTPTTDGGLHATLQRGAGTTLDDQSTLHATGTELRDDDLVLARLAGNLASRGDYDPAADLTALQTAFVVLADAPAPSDAEEERALDAVRDRTIDALDGNPHVAPVGQTQVGQLWRITDAPPATNETTPGPIDTTEGQIALGALAAVTLIVVLLAIPTQRRHTTRRQTIVEDRAPTLEEEVE